MKEVINSRNFNKKAQFNAKSSSLSLKDVTGSIFVVGFAIGKDKSIENDELTDVGYLLTDDGKVYGTISPTAIESIADLSDWLVDGENEPIEVGVVTNTSKGGRDYITLYMV